MKWEYKTLIAANNLELRIGLNKLGTKEWEAFSVVHKNYPNGDDVFFAYLKRPKHESRKNMP